MLMLRHQPTMEERERIAHKLFERATKPESQFAAYDDRDWHDLLNIRNRGVNEAFAVVDRRSQGHFYKFKPFTKNERRHHARVGTKGRRGARRIRANCDCMDQKWNDC